MEEGLLFLSRVPTRDSRALIPSFSQYWSVVFPLLSVRKSLVDPLVLPLDCLPET